ncbi:MAG: aromatic ring-hydroxylating oxygenase subunit alpha [Ilumatobacteraceae bacterium]
MSALNSAQKLSSTLERAAAGLETGLVPAEIFGDVDVHQLERERIFARCWVFIGHESEIPKQGDFRVRSIAGDSFIMVRGADNQVRVLFNACRHRGSTVCRTDAGNASTFRCPYHAWTYSNEGNLLAVPARQTAYQDLNLSEWGLLAAPRVATYRELVFACLDSEAPDLETYLGRFRWYLDIQLGLTEGGMEILGEPHRWIVNADWKSGAENFTGDSSHTQMTHRSLLRLGLVGEAAAGRVSSAHGIHVNNCDGHAISIRALTGDDESWFSYPPDLRQAIANGPLTSDQIELVKRGVVHDGTVFPNFSFIHIGGTIDRTREPAGYLSLRLWQPLGPGRMEIWNWLLVPREATPEYRELAYRAGMATFSPSGNFEQDDTDVWSGIAQTASSLFVRTRDVRFNYQMGMPGMSDVKPMADWPGPGTAWPSNAGESGLRSFHRRWVEQMVAK